MNHEDRSALELCEVWRTARRYCIQRQGFRHAHAPSLELLRQLCEAFVCDTVGGCQRVVDLGGYYADLAELRVDDVVYRGRVYRAAGASELHQLVIRGR